MSAQTRRFSFIFVVVGVLCACIVFTIFLNRTPAARSTTSPAPVPAPLPESTRATGSLTDVSLATTINNLPLRDHLVVSLPSDWTGPTSRPYGVFYEKDLFRGGVPITDLWQDGFLAIRADPENEYCGWWWHPAGQKPDWSELHKGSIAMRVRFSNQMYSQFKVELKSPDKTTIWIVDLKDEDVAKMRQRGFGDISLPLSQADGPNALKAINELALVFEGHRVTTAAGRQTKGELNLHSIRLVPPRGRVSEPSARIDELAARAFDWFEHYRDPQSGLVPDRAPNRRYADSPQRGRLICSTASVGYYLSLLPDAVATRRLTEAHARDRALTVLRFLESNADHHAGLLYHFIDISSGKALTNSEVSALDSAILFNGCMVASVRFAGEVAQIADRLVARADWNAYRLPATPQRPELLAMGWKPDKGFFGPMDVRSTEFAMPYFLAVGAGKAPLDPQLWWNTKVTTGTVAGRRILNPTHGLFTSYYGLGWFRLQGLKDRDGVDFWQNAIDAALANRQFCREEKYQTYAAQCGGWWGISAGDSPNGYIAPGTIRADAGGTVWPTTALAALPWAEKEIADDLKTWEGSPVWEYVDGSFGIAPFNLDARWVGQDLIGIDLGSFCVAVANQRRGTVWNLWKQHPVAQRAMERLYPRQ